MPEPLTDQQVADRLIALSGWSVVDGKLSRTYSFPGHLAAAVMVMHVAQLQEELSHHSDQQLGYNTLTLAVQTHSAGGALTDLDFILAKRIQAVAAAQGAS